MLAIHGKMWIVGISASEPGGNKLLLELRVKDVGIIEEINWSLSKGLNVITGETGAGKSLVVDAVDTLLGGKTDEESIRHGAEEAQIEGVFTLPNDERTTELRDFLAGRGLEADEETLVINWELRRQGRSVARVNGHAVARGLIQQIGRVNTCRCLTREVTSTFWIPLLIPWTCGLASVLKPGNCSRRSRNSKRWWKTKKSLPDARSFYASRRMR